MATEFIERKIVIAAIVSTDFLKAVRPIYQSRLIQSVLAKRMIKWCTDYFDKYEKAPGIDIESIFYSKLKNDSTFPKDVAEEIEEDILPDLNEEYLENGINVGYLIDEATKYFQQRHIQIHTDDIKAFLAEDELEKAQDKVNNYKPLAVDIGDSVNLGDSKTTMERVEKAFTTATESVILFPKALGEFWNHQLIRGGFVALMATEKRGKSYWLLEFAIRAVRQKRKVAFFQAGDMTESQQIRRLAMYLCKKSDREKYIGLQYQPVRDCVHNQMDTCDKEERECDHGIFPGLSRRAIRKQTNLDKLLQARKEFPDYKACHNCKQYESNRWGAVWVEPVTVKSVLEVREAQQAVKQLFVDKKRSFMLSTHANSTLTISKIKALLGVWEKQEGFVPDLVVIDYADLLVAESTTEFRHGQNEVWKGMRNISQEKHCLVMTVTQADASAYEKNRLSLGNFSEDKRKFAHVTAMYGLNQDPQGREKQIGIMRINELVVREGDFNPGNEIYVLQNLRRGRPFLGSFL